MASACRGYGCSLLSARELWFPIVLQLDRFMVAASRVSVNHDGRGGSAPDPLFLDQGSRSKQRRVDIRVHVDLAMLPGPPGFLNWSWFQVRVGSASLVLILLLGPAVSVCCVSSLLCWC